MDPTYNKEIIHARQDYQLAFVLSEIMNDNAPIGWSKYIWIAECLLAHFEIKEKEK